MKMIIPATVTNSILASSNVSEDDYPEWDISTTYNAEDYVIVIGTTHKIYQSLVGSNLGNDPTTDSGTNWLEVGATNRWRAFDNVVNNQVTNTNTITYSLTPDATTNAVAVFNCSAASVNVTVIAQGDEDPIYDQTISLVDNSGVEDWYDYFFAPVEYRTDAVFLDLLAFSGDALDITIDNTGGTAGVGEICFGQIYTIGETLSGTSISIEDYSTKVINDFGEAVIVQRAYRDRADFQVAFASGRAAYLKRLFASRRSTPTVYIADAGMEWSGTQVFGFYSDMDMPLQDGETGTSFATIEIEGLI